MDESLRISVIIPAYDEAENLTELLPRVNAACQASAPNAYQVLVILRDHPGTDELAAVQASQAQAVRRSPTDSFGDAIRSGIAAMDPRSTIVVFLDADGSHDPASIPHMLAALAENDVVVASRYTQGGRSDNGPVLRLMSKTLNLGFRIVLGIRCRDVSTNFKLYRAEQLRSIRLECTNFDVVEEILFRLQQLVRPRPLRIHEIPDYFHERRHGTSKRRLGPFVVSYLGTLWRLRMSARREVG